MAATATFKQQCPTCEAMVSVKETMVGKNVECTKCKDKFIAKKPVAVEDDDDIVDAEIEMEGDDADDVADVEIEMESDDDVVDVDIEMEEAPQKKTKVAAKKSTAVTSKAPTNGKRPKVEIEEEEVEEVDDEEIEDDDEKPQTKSRPKPTSNGKPAKKKARRGKDDEDADEDDDDDEEGTGKKSNKLVLGLVLAGVGVIILGVAAFLFMGGGGNPRNPPNPNFVNKGGNNPKDDNDVPPPPVVVKPPDPVAGPLNDAELAKLSNLLPNDSEHVFRIAFRDLFAANSSLRSAVFETPGALKDADLRKQLGFSVLAIDDMICVKKFTFPSWRYTVIHFSEVVNEADLKAALKLETVGAGINGQIYYKMTKAHPAFDQLAQFSFGIPNYYRYFETPAEGPTLVRLHNSQTLIVGDLAPVLAFLKAKGQFALQTNRQPTAPPDPGKNPMPNPNPNAPPGPGKTGANSAAEGKYHFTLFTEQPPGDPLNLADSTWSGTETLPGYDKLTFRINAGGKAIMIDKKENVPGTWTQLGNDVALTFGGVIYKGVVNGNTMQGTGADGKSNWRFTVTRQGGTPPVNPKGKAKDPTPKDPNPNPTPPIQNPIDPNSKDPNPPPKDPGPGGSREEMYLTIKPSLKAMLDKMETRPNDKDRTLFSSATDMDANTVDLKDPAFKDTVIRLPRQFWDISLLVYEPKPRIRFLGTALVQRDTLRYQLRNELSCGQEIDAKEFQKDIVERTSPSVAKFIQQLVKHEVKLPKLVDAKVPMPPVPAPPPPGPKDPPKDDKKPAEAVVSQITVNQQGVSVDFVLDLVLDNPTLTQAHGIAALTSAILRAEIDNAAAKSSRHLLADAGRGLGLKGQFPPGAFPRTNARAYVDKEPRNRISWMAGLLPYLGQQNLYNKMKFDQSWRDSSNWLAGHTTVPQFLDPMYPDFTRQASVSDLPIDFAATHYVGIAGVGLDAATYRRGDPATLHKQGIFGYDSSASLADVANGRGAANTILMIQIPYDRGTGVAPWIAGGGATLRGVPEKNSIEPFILGKDRNDKVIQHEAKKGVALRGTYAVMADGTVRFIDQSISDDVFKAMCTVNGPAPEGFNPKTDPKTPLIPSPDAKEPAVKTPDKKPADPTPTEKQPPIEVKAPDKKPVDKTPAGEKEPAVVQPKPKGPSKLTVPDKFTFEAPAGFTWSPGVSWRNLPGKAYYASSPQSKGRLVLVATERSAATDSDKLILLTQLLEQMQADFRDGEKYKVTPKSKMEFKPPIPARIDLKFEGVDKDGKAIAVHAQVILGRQVYLIQAHAPTPAEAQSLLKSAATLAE